MTRPSNVSFEQACCALASRLRERSPEIELAVVNRIQKKAPIEQNAEPLYVHGLRAAIRGGIDYTLGSIETGGTNPPPMPSALLGQARLAARHGVDLGTVLCRYTFGAHQLREFIIAEARQDPHLQGDRLQRLLKEQALVLEGVLTELKYEYGRESVDRPRSLDALHADIVKRRLAGEPVDTSALNYELDRHHIGVVTQGDGSEPLLRELAKAVDGRPLVIRPGGDSIWAWIGTRHRIDPEQLQKHVRAQRSPTARLGFGEPGARQLGWRHTHLQALEAFPYALRDGATTVRYADILSHAAIEQNDLAVLSLHEIYIAPLERQANGDDLLCTLRAYFAAGRNAAAAESALGVSRQTVSKRLRSVEALLGKPLEACCPDLEIALRLHDFRECTLA